MPSNLLLVAMKTLIPMASTLVVMTSNLLDGLHPSIQPIIGSNDLHLESDGRQSNRCGLLPTSNDLQAHLFA